MVHVPQANVLSYSASTTLRKPEERRRLKVNARMATVDHDRQGQAAHRRYKLHTTVEVASGKGDEYSTLISAM